MSQHPSSADDLADEAMSLDGYFSDAPLEPQPRYPPIDESFDRCVVISNLPKVPESKYDKLAKVVQKLVSRIGNLSSYDNNDDDNEASSSSGGGIDDGRFAGFYMPKSENDGMTAGCALVEYESAGDAKKAIEVLEGYKFDKNHSLKVTPYERVAKLMNVVEGEFLLPEPEPFKERPNTMTWLEDTCQRDQFAIRQGKETAVYWNDGRGEPVIDYDGARERKAGVNWCDYYVQWSPKGSYLATLVPNKGVILWGGKGFEKLGRFAAPGVNIVVFSPQENYMLTSNNNKKDPNAIKIWSIQSGTCLRTFPLYPKDFLDPSQSESLEGEIPPPPFQWSHDDKYLARMGKDLISIFETPSMKLLDKRSLATDGIHEFQFSPKANVIAYWAPEHKNQPAHVDLVEIPSRKQLRQKNLFNVTKCSMVWQESGEYLGVKVTRHTKSKKTLYNNLELFRVNEPGVPVEMLDVKDAVMSFAWEPQGSRFAIIHAENPTSTKVNVTFYDMYKTIEVEKKKGAGNKKAGGGGGGQVVAEVNLVETLEGKQCNCIFWSPAGRTVILAALGDSASGTLEFYDVDSKTLVIKEHYRANQVLWDPSGRTVATTVSQPIGGGHFKFAMDNGYVLWTFQGKQLSQSSFEAFYQFAWRPRERLTSKEEIAVIARNIKKYEKQFNAFDEAKKRKLRLQETKGKRKSRAEFRAVMARLGEWRERQKQERMELLGGYDSEDEQNFTTKEVTIETVLNTKEDLVY
jgi:translation initiation factor 3 subunit B